MNLDALVAFAERAIHAANEHKKLVLGVVSNAPLVLASTDFDVEGFVHSLDNFGLKHGFKHHGIEAREALRGQRAVRVDDVQNIPATLAAPDQINFLGLSKHSRQPMIAFEKLFGAETLVYVVELRQGKRELATQTFYIRRGK